MIKSMCYTEKFRQVTVNQGMVYFAFKLIFLYLAIVAPSFSSDRIAQAHECLRIQDFDCAFLNFKLEAKLGDAEAQYNLGIMYERGESVKESKGEALRWFSKAANNGYVKAQLSLGLHYGIYDDFYEAIKWLREAGNNGEPLAQYLMARYHRYGRGTTKNIEMAVEWYLKASEQGYTSAQNEIAKMYEKGDEISPDKEVSIFWYGKACENGSKRGCTKYNKLNAQSYSER